MPLKEIPRIKRLKKQFHLKSNTEVVRLALQELDTKVSRVLLREQFKKASHLVSQANKADLAELDLLSDEGLT